MITENKKTNQKQISKAELLAMLANMEDISQDDIASIQQVKEKAHNDRIENIKTEFQNGLDSHAIKSLFAGTNKIDRISIYINAESGKLECAFLTNKKEKEISHDDNRSAKPILHVLDDVGVIYIPKYKTLSITEADKLFSTKRDEIAKILSSSKPNMFRLP